MSKRKRNKFWIDLAIAIVLVVAAYYYAAPEKEQTPINAQTTAVSAVNGVGEPQNDNGVVQQVDNAAEEVHYELPTLVADRPQQVIEHLAYTVSYNPEWRIPNWVAYELTAHETEGAEERNNKFLPDPLVEGDPVVTSDYTKSGYDRGHMAPAADMKWSAQAMRESFYMTNMCPQNHSNNAGDWKDLENLARDWAVRYGNIYICCGPIVSANPEHIGTKRRIVVPERFYKVFLRQKGQSWTAIGFVMQNAAGSKPLMTYMVSVDEVERLTGIDMFPALPDDIEAQVEADYTVADWTL